jgi:Holliday junction resolvase
MGKRERNKGSRVEREIANFLGGKRVPLSGATSYAKGDIEAYNMRFEVKARKDGFKQIYQWLGDNDGLIIKADRKEAIVCLPISTFKELMEGEGNE